MVEMGKGVEVQVDVAFGDEGRVTYWLVGLPCLAAENDEE